MIMRITVLEGFSFLHPAPASSSLHLKAFKPSLPCQSIQFPSRTSYNVPHKWLGSPILLVPIIVFSTSTYIHPHLGSSVGLQESSLSLPVIDVPHTHCTPFIRCDHHVEDVVVQASAHLQEMQHQSYIAKKSQVTMLRYDGIQE
jgi:hypothetical protein